MTALARIVAEGSEQTRSLSDAFASANNDFSPRLRGAASGAFIGDYEPAAPRLLSSEAPAKREAEEAAPVSREPVAALPAPVTQPSVPFMFENGHKQ